MNEKTSFGDLINELSVRVDKSQDTTQDFIRGLVGIIEAGLRSGGSVTITGFGKFELRWMNERKGINPHTKEEITIPGQNKVVFKPYKSLRDHVNRPYARMESQVLNESPDDKEKDKDPIKITPAIPETKHKPEKPEPESESEDPFQLDDPVKTEEEKVDAGLENEEVSPPFPFFIEEDDEAEDFDPDEELLIERPSPITDEISKSEFHESELVEQVQEDGTFRWSYAATIIVLMIILAIIYILPFDREPAEIATETPIEQPQPQPDPRPLPEIDNNNGLDIEETNLITIIVDGGQNLWNLALEYLGDPYLWPWIFHLNSDTVESPDVIISDSDLTIPVPADIENLSDEDLQEVAYGYISVYHWYKENASDEARNFLWAAGSFYLPVLDEVEGEVDVDDLRFARNR